MYYTMKQISNSLGVSEQSLYALKRKNIYLQTLINDHSLKKGRIIKYDEIIYKWYSEYYSMECDENFDKEAEKAPSLGCEMIPSEPSFDCAPIEEALYNGDENPYDKMIQSVKTQINFLEEQLKVEIGLIGERLKSEMDISQANWQAEIEILKDQIAIKDRQIQNLTDINEGLLLTLTQEREEKRDVSATSPRTNKFFHSFIKKKETNE